MLVRGSPRAAFFILLSAQTAMVADDPYGPGAGFEVGYNCLRRFRLHFV